MTLFKLYHELLMHQIDYASKTLFRSSERCNVGPKIVWCIFRVHVKTGFFNFPQATVQPQVTYTVIMLNLAFSCDYLVQYLFSSTPFFSTAMLLFIFCALQSTSLSSCHFRLLSSVQKVCTIFAKSWFEDDDCKSSSNTYGSIRMLQNIFKPDLQAELYGSV